MLKIQEFINCFDTIEEANKYLKQNLNIGSETTTVYEMNNSYQTIAYKPLPRAELTNPLVKETHCLLLDGEGDIMSKAWNHPVIVENREEFPKEFVFGNYNTAEEIPDGGIVVIYNIEGKWLIGSPNSTFGGDFPPGLSLPSFSYSRLVKHHLSARHERWDEPFNKINPMLCFVFSYVCEFAKTIMPIRKSQMYLMAVINLENGNELSYGLVKSLADGLKVETPAISAVKDIPSLSKQLNTMRTLCPGLMLRDTRDTRVMVVNPIYTCMKNAIDAADRVKPIHIAKLLTVIRDRRDMESITSAYPDVKNMLNLFWNTRVELWQELLALWKLAKPVRDDMHAFAKTIQHHPLNYILFKVKDLSVSILDEVENLKPTRLEKLTRERHEKRFDSAARLLKFLGGDLKNADEESIPFCQEGD